MGASDLHAHLAGGPTTVARCWALTRADGTRLGFTDHDRDLSFDGLLFRAGTGMSALALQQVTGLSVDNTEAMGALSDAALCDADIEAGRFDGAALTAWLVNWADVAQRQLMFRGTIGEIRRGDGAFHVELRGLTEALNLPRGRVYQKPCSAVLGDRGCGFDLATPGYVHSAVVLAVTESRRFDLGPMPGFEEGWFTRGRLDMQSGAGAGLGTAIKRDRTVDGVRVIELWEPLRAALAPGDICRITAGCDKRLETCRFKFDNLINFQGFPDIPEDDWMLVHASRAAVTDGGSRR
ncbi:DUF2163 domain-containing protein [Salipiger mangrovisoli]|uniref:DUF2163 domain-containing protein n=1 Tax=Salipiger mangrovisoli TaxID=2865933 RepID=A0ABR9WWP3_9RHOB|nr:DUF2163 domain-containing protein [Salipiger mangrovisoli]MBE9635714.1 DUF2163 domain-containing protein [Salipiger mangrovisoli]